MTVRRHCYNVSKIAGFALFGIIGLALIGLGTFWPLLLWSTFEAPLSVSVAILIVWWVSLI